jgi:hypothetical protein
MPQAGFLRVQKAHRDHFELQSAHSPGECCELQRFIRLTA